MRRILSIALLAIAALSISPSVSHAAESNTNTPKLALHKVELWLAASEPKPSTADLDAGSVAATAAEERMTMLNTEMGAIASRRRTLQLQASAARQKIAELRSDPRGENGIKRGSVDQKIVDLEQKIEALQAQAETLYGYMRRIGDEESGIVDAIGRMRGVADMIGSSTLADAKQKGKAAALGSKTTKTVRLHAAMIMTLMNATTASQ